MTSLTSNERVCEPSTNCWRRSSEKSLKTTTCCFRNLAVLFALTGSIKQRVHHAKLYAPVVAAVHAVLGFFEAVEGFQADAQALAELPDYVRAGVMAKVVEVRALPARIVQVVISIS